MRLLIVSSEFPPGPGGIGNQAHQLALHLGHAGWDVAVITPQDYVSPDRAAAFNTRQPFRIVPVTSGRGRLLEAQHRWRVARRVVSEHKPDLMVGTGLSGVHVVSALDFTRSRPVAAVAHGSEFGGGTRARLLSRVAYERMTAVVAVSQFTRGVIERAGIRPRRVEVIPNAADAGRFSVMPDNASRAFREAAGFGDLPLILTVGQVSDRKGQEIVIRALPAILEQRPTAHYVMAGLPTLEAPLSAIARDLGVRDHVHFLGSVPDDDLVAWMNCADVFVMASRETATGDCEGFGIAVVEAALCGTPAVVTRQSGLIEAIEEGVTGLAVPENDVPSTARAIVSLLTDPARRRAMGDAARARAERQQTWRTCAAEYDALFRDLCAS